LLVQLLKSSSNEWRCTINILSHYRTSLRILCHKINKLKKIVLSFSLSNLTLTTTYNHCFCLSVCQFLFLFYLFSLFFNRTLENGTTLTSSQRLKVPELIERKYIEQQQRKNIDQRKVQIVEWWRWKHPFLFLRFSLPTFALS